MQPHHCRECSSSDGSTLRERKGPHTLPTTRIAPRRVCRELRPIRGRQDQREASLGGGVGAVWRRGGLGGRVAETALANEYRPEGAVGPGRRGQFCKGCHGALTISAAVCLSLEMGSLVQISVWAARELWSFSAGPTRISVGAHMGGSDSDEPANHCHIMRFLLWVQANPTHKSCISMTNSNIRT